MADFPANGKAEKVAYSIGEFVGTILGVAILLIGIGAWVLGVGMLIHGGVTLDLWEVIRGAIILTLMFLLRMIWKAFR